MPVLRILLTLCSLYALFRLGDDTPATAHTAYLPIGARRIWSVAALACTLALWLTEAWWMIALSMLTLFGAMVCRNVCIRWDDRKLRITGAMGLQWTYEYAQVRYLPGKWPVIIIGMHPFVLWPGLVYRDTFLAHARERMRIVRYAQAYRKRSFADPKSNDVNRGCMLINVGFALALAALVSFTCWPVSEDTGSIIQAELEGAYISGSTINLNFIGYRVHRIPNNDRTAPLLEEDAIGKTYTIQHKYQTAGRRHNRYYSVIALADSDGTVYRTWQESAAVIDRLRPYAILSGIVGWFMFRKKPVNKSNKRR